MGKKTDTKLLIRSIVEEAANKSRSKSSLDNSTSEIRKIKKGKSGVKKQTSKLNDSNVIKSFTMSRNKSLLRSTTSVDSQSPMSKSMAGFELG